jgi:hypothetical protein
MPNTDPKTVVLPEHSDMLEHLRSVIDNQHAEQKFFPLLLKDAGRRLNGMGVVMMLELAIFDYCKGMPPIMVSIMHMHVRRLVEVLVNDDEVKADALRMLDDVNKRDNE